MFLLDAIPAEVRLMNNRETYKIYPSFFVNILCVSIFCLQEVNLFVGSCKEEISLNRQSVHDCSRNEHWLAFTYYKF